ncbi:insulinase family protein [Clostridium perfringens]|uniref:insulinase family protein n=1 Tax=Clostridium perfringens TaxID=1502 RepID=UPI001123D8F5|nr:insulinase family protein [Clostridium perfringens]TPE20459.1 insulinase family protein [Clostridium perfringens]
MIYKELKLIQWEMNYCLLNLVIPHGSNKSLKPGLAHLIEHLIVKNDINNGKSLKSVVENLGGQIEANTSREETIITISILNNLEEIILALNKCFEKINISDECLKNEIDVISQEISFRNKEEDFIIYNKIYENIIGPKETILGEVNNLKQIEKSIIVEHFERFYRSENIMVEFFGTAKEIKKVKKFIQVRKKFYIDKENRELAICISIDSPLKKYLGLAFGDLCNVEFKQNNIVKIFNEQQYLFIKIKVIDEIELLFEKLQNDFVLKRTEKFKFYFSKRLKQMQDNYFNEQSNSYFINSTMTYFIDLFEDESVVEILNDKIIKSFNCEVNKIFKNKQSLKVENKKKYTKVELVKRKYLNNIIICYATHQSINEEKGNIIFSFDVSKFNKSEDILIIKNLCKKYFFGEVLYKGVNFKISYFYNPEIMHIKFGCKTEELNYKIEVAWEYIFFIVQNICKQNNCFKIQEGTIFDSMYLKVLKDKLIFEDMPKESCLNLSKQLIAITIISNNNNYSNNSEKVMLEKMSLLSRVPLKGKFIVEKGEYSNLKGEIANIMFGARGFALNSREKYKLHILWKMLDNTNGILSNIFRDSEEGIYVNKAFSQEFYRSGIFIIYLVTNASNLKKVVNKLYSVLKEIGCSNIRYKQIFDVAKKSLILDFRKNNNLENELISFCNYILYDNVLEHYYCYEEYIEKITFEEISELCKLILDELFYTVIYQ